MFGKHAGMMSSEHSVTKRDYADLIVVGSGPAGAASARSVADRWPDARIVMVESGPRISTPPGHHVSNLASAAERQQAELLSQGPNRGIAYSPITEAEWMQRIAGEPDEAMLRRPGLFPVGRGDPAGAGLPAGHGASNVGGMGAHWFGGCPRPALSERVPFIDGATMDSALDAAEAMLHSAADQYPDSPIAPILEARLGALFDAGRSADRRVQPMPMALQRRGDIFIRTGPDVMLGDLLDAGLERFDLRADTICRRILFRGSKAVGVELFNVQTQATEVLHGGTVVVAADSLHSPQLLWTSGVRPAALGHFLNEHLQVGLMVELDETPVSDAVTGVTWVPYVDESFPFSITLTQAVPSMLPFGAGRADPKRPIIFVSLFATMDLQFGNEVRFSETALDWRGLPALLPHLQPSANDLRRIEQARDVVRRIAAALGRPVPGVTFMRPPYGSSLHYQGTVRMGATDDGTSVCDRDGRVWGYDNLHVAGNGVIPTVTATNPTLTSVALAILAGREVAKTLGPK